MQRKLIGVLQCDMNAQLVVSGGTAPSTTMLRCSVTICTVGEVLALLGARSSG
jgi:hypothetical protein